MYCAGIAKSLRVQVGKRENTITPMTTPVFLAMLVMVFLAPVSVAEMLEEDVIRKLVIENTVTGRYNFGGWFSEYHAEDGRVFGNNGWEDNSDACWTTKKNAICYAYGKAPNRQTYCFTFERTGESLILRNLSDGQLNAVAKVEKGNPRNHTDRSKSWSCEEKVSRSPNNFHFAPANGLRRKISIMAGLDGS